MAKTNTTRFAILGVLSIKPASGYEIKKFCDQTISFFWAENFGQIYPELHKLRDDGLIEICSDDEAEGRSRKYRLRPEGLLVLREWLRLPVEVSPLRSELLLKTVFGNLAGSDSILKEIAAAQARNTAQAALLLRMEADFLANGPAKRDKSYPYWLAALRYGIQGAQMTIKWCEETIADIQNFERIPKEPAK